MWREEKRKEQETLFLLLFLLSCLEVVPRAGVEPARVAPLVFETSASTDSAIWASKAVAKVTLFCENDKFLPEKMLKCLEVSKLLCNLVAKFRSLYLRMINNNDCFCVILAGGKGRRLWPCSREQRPKQFMDFFGTGRTQLQQTFDRFAKLVPKENIYVSTNRVYAHFVEEQLPELPQRNILSEPIHRNTAPSVAWAAYRIARRNPNAMIVVSPSDQAVIKEDVFGRDVMQCLELSGMKDVLVTMGVVPTRPEPGYGYIQLGDRTGVDNLYKVQSFTEKPDREFARMFVESGEFYWNTGVFFANVRYLITCLRKILPVVFREIDKEDMAVSYEEELRFVEENFAKYPNLSVDYGILERSDRVYVKRCDFGWADLGTWHSIYEALSHVEGENVVIDSEVLLEDSRNNIVKLPKDHLGVINGLDGYIVAEKGNVLLICKKGDSSALIRKYANEVQIKLGEEFV